MVRKKLIKRRKICSTPKKIVSKVPSVSISSITPNSSLSIERLRRRIDKEAEVRRKSRKKQSAVPKRKGKKYVKPRIRKKPTVSESSWETTLEFTDDEKENLQSANSSPKTAQLFQNYPSPTLERVREAHCFYDSHFDSPVFRRGEDIVRSARIDLGESLHLKDLPSIRPLVYSSDEEDELLLTREQNKPSKTYPGVSHRRKPKISVDKSKQCLRDVKWPTAAADMLWDEYVQAHPEEMHEYVAPTTDQNVASLPKRKKNNYNRDKAHEEYRDKYRFDNKYVDKDAPEATCYRIGGHYNKFTKKWTRIKYPEDDDSDSDFRRSETGAPKKTLNQYLEKCRTRKHLASQMAGPSCSEYDEVTNVTYRKRKIVNVNDDLKISNTGDKTMPVIRSIKTLKNMRYVRKGSKWFVICG